MTPTVPLLVLLVGLTGCVSVINVQMEKLRIRNDVMAAATEISACTDKLKAVQRYSRLYDKVALDALSPPTSAQLNDQARPSDEEIQLGMEWYSDAQICSQLAAEKSGSIDPDFGAYVVNNLADNAALFREVITERPTFGYINTKISEFHQKRIRESRRWAENLDARLTKLKEEQERAAAAQQKLFMSSVGAVTEVATAVFLGAVAGLAAQQNALAQAQRERIIVLPSYRPVRITHTSCSYIGRSLSCQQSGY